MYEFDLSHEEAEKILHEMIAPQATSGITPSDRKMAFVLGGQPGSGKSAFAREILQQDKNLVFINGDDLRAYHPKYYFYLRENDIEAVNMTQAVCSYWIESLVSECIKRNLNFIIEGTMRKTEGPLRTAREVKESGYSLNLVAIATPYELSLVSIERRYKEIKKLEGFARFTKKESHDEAYNNIEHTFKELSDSGLFERILIYKRYAGGFKEQTFHKNEKEQALAEFQEGRRRLVDEEEREMLNSNSGFEIKIKK
jgi:UDP-N-acetylglucosamine kinase